MLTGRLLLSLAVLKSIFRVATYQLSENNHKRTREVVVVVVIIAVLLTATVVEKNKSFLFR